MKYKTWILWLCVVALLATEIFLFSANRQKDAMRVALRESQLEAGQLRGQLDQLKNSSVATLSAENARLRAENQSLSQKFSQLQNESRQLHKANQQMTQQLQATTEAAQQQQQQPMQVEDQPASAAPEPSVAQSAAAIAQFNACVNNLQQIDAAKQQWAMENDKADDAIPTALELLPYLPDAVFPTCPAGGTYTINAVGVSPTCSIRGHALPQ